MADERGLAGLDPYDLQDEECARLSNWFGGMTDAEWSTPSACDGWSRRDLLAHLVAVEEYFAACLQGSVAALLTRYLEGRASSLDDFNAAGVAASEGVDPQELLATWVQANAANRAGFRAADGTEIDTSAGSYPCRLQAFHVAFEYAVHADDVDAPVAADDRERRRNWLAGVARFALTEVKTDVTVDDSTDGFIVARSGQPVTVDLDTFVAGVAGRSEPGTIDQQTAELLGLGY